MEGGTLGGLGLGRTVPGGVSRGSRVRGSGLCPSASVPRVAYYPWKLEVRGLVRLGCRRRSAMSPAELQSRREPMKLQSHGRTNFTFQQCNSSNTS